MTIHDLNHRSICILGYGREGQSVVRALEKYAPDTKVTIADANENIERKNYQLSIINYQLGDDYLDNLDTFNIIIKSPGIHPSSKLKALSSKLTNATQIFFDTVQEKGSIIIGVTGTKGKSTTASLITSMLKHTGKDAHLVGNIGVPVLDFIEKAKQGTIFVQELSSYQLGDVTSSPHIAVITSFFPDHLDYHKSLDVYRDAKKHITEFQKEEDIVFFAEGTEEIAHESIGTKHLYSEKDSPVRIEETKLIGMHNQRNIAGAWRVVEYLGIEKADAIDAIKNFEGLPHRLENIGMHHGATWIDDAISTTPESTIIALQAIPEVDIFICGGQDRGYNFAELGKAIDRSFIKTIILFPDSGAKIKASISNESINFLDANNMEEAIQMAKQKIQNSKFKIQNSSVLLSPASPSYNMFKNFEEKGNLFKKYAIQM
jgi:UDP-N-acetylmuramoyl-L-alanine---L-glutamate ligase